MKLGQPNSEIQGNLNPISYNQPQIHQLCTPNQTTLESNKESQFILQPNTSSVPSFPGQYPTQMLANQSESSDHILTSVPIQSPESLPDALEEDASRLHQSGINSSNQVEKQSQEQFVRNAVNQVSDTYHQYPNVQMASFNQNSSSYLSPQMPDLTKQQSYQPMPQTILVQQPYHHHQPQAILQPQAVLQAHPVIVQPAQGILTPLGTPDACASGISPSPSALLMSPEIGCLNASAVGTAIMSLPVFEYPQQLAPQTLDPLVVNSEVN